MMIIVIKIMIIINNNILLLRYWCSVLRYYEDISLVSHNLKQMGLFMLLSVDFLLVSFC